MHLVALRNNRVWSAKTGTWNEAGSVCGSIAQRDDSSAWVIYSGVSHCFFLVEDGVAVAQVVHDNLSIVTTVSAPVTRLSPLTVAGGKAFCIGICSDGACMLISFDGDRLVATPVRGLYWPVMHVPPVLESVGSLFFLCPSAVYLRDRAAQIMSHGVLSHGGRLMVPLGSIPAAAPAHRVFCQTPRFSVSTNGVLAVVDGDTFDLRTLLEPVEVSVGPSANGQSEILVGSHLDTLMPALIGGRVVCEAADGFARQSDIVSLRQDDEGLRIRLDRPLVVAGNAVLKVYGGFSADCTPYQLAAGPHAGQWLPRGVVSCASWMLVDGVLCVAVSRPGEVVVVQISGGRVIAARRLGASTPAVHQMAYDGEAVHIIDTVDRWARNQRPFPVAGVGIGISDT